MLQLSDILAPGISGNVVRPPQVDEHTVRLWQECCDEASRQLRGKRLGEQPVAVARNFWSFGLELYPSRQVVHVLLHSILPYVGVASTLEWMQNEYAESSAFEPLFPSPFTFLPTSLLEQPFSLEPWMIPRLDKGALYDIKYWDPKRVGDLVFNYFD